MDTILVTGGSLVDIFIGAPPNRQLPPPGGAAVVDQIALAAGGCAVNTAACLGILISKLKRTWKISLWCRQALDSGAGLIRSELASKGVDASSHWIEDPQFPAKCSVVLLPGQQENENPDRSFLKTRGMGNALSYTDLLATDFTKVRHLHIGGIYSLRNVSGAELAEGLKHAKLQNSVMTVSVDTVASSDGRWAELLPSLEAGVVDWFLPSLDEAEAIIQFVEPGTKCGTEEEIAAWFHARGAKKIAIKLAARGAFFSTDGSRSGYISAPQVKAVDTTGAGDAFCAGFILAALSGRGIEEATKFGVECGSAVVSALGSTAGLEQWIASHQGLSEVESLTEFDNALFPSFFLKTF